VLQCVAVWLQCVAVCFKEKLEVWLRATLSSEVGCGLCCSACAVCCSVSSLKCIFRKLRRRSELRCCTVSLFAAVFLVRFVCSGRCAPGCTLLQSVVLLQRVGVALLQ